MNKIGKKIKINKSKQGKAKDHIGMSLGLAILQTRIYPIHRDSKRLLQKKKPINIIQHNTGKFEIPNIKLQ